MPGPTLFPSTDLKKDYKFLWEITANVKTVVSAFTSMSLDLEIKAAMVALFNPATTAYVSQLAESVQLPDDEVEMEDYKVGNITYPIPKGMSMGDITVTYMDDTYNSVYTFHKAWQGIARKGTTMCLNPLKSVSAAATFITVEDTLSQSEYSSIADRLQKGQDIGDWKKPMSVTTWPLVFPRTISRTEASRAGQGLSKVTVRYVRMPSIKASPAYTHADGGTDFSNDVISKWKP